MVRIVAVLETMWDWRGMTSGAGYQEAPQFFRINPENVSGRRLYKLIGDQAQLLVTNACRELVCGPQHHGKPDPQWLKQNLDLLATHGMDILLVCGKVAQKTFAECGYSIAKRRVLLIPHPAARFIWTEDYTNEVQMNILRAVAWLARPENNGQPRIRKLGLPSAER